MWQARSGLERLELQGPPSMETCVHVLAMLPRLSSLSLDFAGMLQPHHTNLSTLSHLTCLAVTTCPNLPSSALTHNNPPPPPPGRPAGGHSYFVLSHIESSVPCDSGRPLAPINAVLYMPLSDGMLIHAGVT